MTITEKIVKIIENDSNIIIVIGTYTISIPLLYLGLTNKLPKEIALSIVLVLCIISMGILAKS